MIARDIKRSLAAGLAVMLVAAGAAFAAGGPVSVGSVAALRNQVDVRAGGAPRPRAAILGQRMALGDQVQTGDRSHMQLLLLDRSSFTVGQNARLTIDRFVYDPGGGSFTATVAKGALRFMSGGAHGKGGASIRTPIATIGIRGTIVDTVVGEEAIAIAEHERALTRMAGGRINSDPATASLIVLRGPGPRDRRPGAISITAGGKTIDLDRPLLAVYVPGPGQAPIGPFTISLPGQAILNDLILPELDARLPEPTDLRDFYPRGSEPAGQFPGGAPPEFFGSPQNSRSSGIPNMPQFPQTLGNGQGRPAPNQRPAPVTAQTPAPTQTPPPTDTPSQTPPPREIPSTAPAPGPSPSPSGSPPTVGNDHM
jgi:hypothetical protein